VERVDSRFVIDRPIVYLMALLVSQRRSWWLRMIRRLALTREQAKKRECWRKSGSIAR